MPENPTAAQKLKYEICREFVIYANKHKDIRGKDLAKKLKIDPARMSEIVKYRIDLFTVDRLLGYLERLNPEIKIKVG